MKTMSKEALKLWFSSTSTLKVFMNLGKQPNRESLVGEYLGLNTGPLPKWLGFQKFVKSLRISDAWLMKPMELIGNNFRVTQNGFAELYIKLMKDGKPVEQGYFVVESASNNPNWNHYPDAAFLDYGKGDNDWKEPARFLRDYLVQPFPDNKDILLGHAFIYILGLKISVGFFVLQKVTE